MEIVRKEDVSMVYASGDHELRSLVGVTSCVSILLTFGVSLVVGLFVARKNKKIDKVESLKCAE